jgi:hypothetical protein
MEKQWFGGIIAVGALLVVLTGITPAVAGTSTSGGDEGQAIEASGPASFGTEEWVEPSGETQVVVVGTPAFGTEDWIEPPGEPRIVAMAPTAYGTEEWTGTMESSEALGAGAVPAPSCEDVSMDDYSPEC